MIPATISFFYVLQVKKIVFMLVIVYYLWLLETYTCTNASDYFSFCYEKCGQISLKGPRP